MRQKLYTLLIALAALAVGASATAQITKYNVWVAGTQVTSANASDITKAINNPAIATGTITYNAATKTLTLNNAKITSDGDGIQCYIRTTIRLEGASAVTVTGSNGILFYMAPGTITGSGSLEVTAADVAVFLHATSLIIRDCTLKASGLWGIAGNNSSVSETLVVENASVKGKGTRSSIADISSLTLTGCAITSPTGAAFDASKKGVAAGGELVKNEWVEIKPVTEYPIDVAGTRVTPANAKDITAAIGNPAIATGIITYDAASGTLTLNNAKITTSAGPGIMCRIPTTIRLEGTSAVTATNAAGISFYKVPGIITGPGSLDVTSADAAVYFFDTSLIIRSCTLTASGKWGIAGTVGDDLETLVIENASVKGKGTRSSIADISSLTLTGCEITSPAGAAFDPSKKGVAVGGELVKNEWVEIKLPFMEYPLKVAGKQVTSANASDITATIDNPTIAKGEISYNHFNRTLTLNEATINSSGVGIESSVEGLTIQLIGDGNHVNAEKTGLILSKKSEITGAGQLYIKSNIDAGIYSLNSHLTVSGGCFVEASGKWGIVGRNGNAEEKLTVINSMVRAKGTDISIGDIYSLTMHDCSIKSPDGAEFNAAFKGVVLNGALVKNDWVEIQPRYQVQIAGRNFFTQSAANIPWVQGAHFDSNTYTLTLDGVNIDWDESFAACIILRYADHFTVKLLNNNKTIGGIGMWADSDITFQGGGTLEIKESAIGIWANKDLKIEGKSTVKAEGEFGGIFVDEGFTVNNSTVYAKANQSYSLSGMSSFNLINCKITAPENAVFRSDQSATGVYVGDQIVGSGTGVVIEPTGTGLESLTSQGIRVWGGKGVIKIVPPAELVETNTAYIYGVSGTLVRALPLGSGDMFVSNIPAGIYMVKIGDAAEKVIVR